MLTNTSLSPFRRAAASSIGLAVLWVVVALLRSGTTFHLAPALVAAVLPVVFAYDGDDRTSARPIVVAALAGLVVALVATLVLAATGLMTGPSLLPFGGAVTESVVFAIAGAIGGLAIAMLHHRSAA